MKLQYSITAPDTIRVKMGVKPASTSDKGLEDEYKKGIELTCDVKVDGLPKDYDLKSVPEVILNHFVSSVKVEVQAPYRAKALTKIAYEKAYDALKDKCKNVQTHNITLERSRAKSSKSKGAIETLLESYGKDRVKKHVSKIAEDIFDNMEQKELLLKWATILEKENLK